jgi:hypothetical protein
MSSIYTNVLSNEELDYFINHPNVLKAKASIDTKNTGKIYFSVPITNEIRSALQSRLGLNLSVNDQIPMRWIKGDTSPHIDVGASKFTTTYLMYFNDSPGNLIIDAQYYPIQSNTGFVFNEGLSHETQNTENIPRLLLGPMNELAEPVGTALSYYPTEADAINYTNALGYGISYTVGDGGPFGPGGGYTSWRIASNSNGTSPTNVVYTNGSLLNNDGAYYLYPSAPCFLEGTTILCQVDGVEKYIPVEQLKKGTMVKTSLDGYKAVVLVGKGNIQNPDNDERIENRLYKCSTSNYPQLKDDLYITGCHSILEFPITEKQKEDTIKHLGRLFITDKKYRLMACVDERAEPWNSKGDFPIWHFALENADERMNYGVYANGGLLVETCSIFFLKKKSNMECRI